MAPIARATPSVRYLDRFVGATPAPTPVNHPLSEHGLAVARAVAHLTEPGREIHALDLVGAPGLVGGDDGGPVLDAAAKDAYRHRLNDLAEDLEEARSNSDPAAPPAPKRRSTRSRNSSLPRSESVAATGGRPRSPSGRASPRRVTYEPSSTVPPTFTRRSLATSR